jgi:hypothetical protein
MSLKSKTVHDSIGPGTPAWTAFDNALKAWINCPDGQRHQGNKMYKAYTNYRQYMIDCLCKAGTDEVTIAAWLRSLREACTSHALDEFGEWV